ncbi:MAG: hypothetical protein ACT4RN_04350, partial [Pseudonocardia sp.]
GLAMTFDDEARAQRNLELAATRLTEVERLIALRGGSGVDPQLVAAAMSEFDVATSEGSRTLLGGQDAARNGGTLQAWAAAQSARLSALRPALPVPAVPAADTSIALLDELLGRSADPAAPSTGEDTGTADEAREAGTSGQPSARVPAGTPGGQPSAESERGLPPLQPDNGPLTGEPQVEQPAGETPSDVDGQEPGRLPLPLPGAPITLPPLLPGMPPLIIG